MSAVRVTAQRGTVWPRLPWAFAALALTVGLVVGLAVGTTMATRTTTQGAISALPVTLPARTHAGPMRSTAPMAAYRQLVANIRVAESRHDFAARFRFTNQLSAMLTAQTIGSIYQEHALLASYLAAAKANGEHHAVSRINQRIAAICGPKAVKARLDFCN